MSTATYFNPALHLRAGDGTFTEMFHAEAAFTLDPSVAPGLDLAWIQGVKDDLALVLGAGDAAAQERIDTYGGIDMAVVAVGDAVAARAEEIAGVTTMEVRAGWGERSTEAAARFEKAKVAVADFTPEEGNNNDRYWNTRQELGAASDALQRTRDGRDEETLADMRRLSDGYLAALTEVRPMGGELTLHPDSDERASGIFAAAAQYYPTEFLAASNADTPLMAKSTGGRAHYRDRVMLEKKEKRPVVSHKSRASFSPDPEAENNPRYDWKPVDYRGPASVLNVEKSRWVQVEDAQMYESSRFDVIEPGEYFRAKKDGTPWGKGWVKWEHPVNERVYWRRPRTEEAVVESRVVSNILVDGNINPYVADMDPNMATALHELAHRSEAAVNRPPMLRSTQAQIYALGSVPVIDLEEEFLQRRTTFSGKRQKLERMYPETRGSKEMTRPDHFPARYMGKDYGGQYTEIMSVGMESVFAGEKGGLIGIGRHDADTDTRNFILGTLAVATGKRVRS